MRAPLEKDMRSYANGIPPHYFGALLGAPGKNWSARLDRAMPDRILQFLGEHTCIPLEDIAALTIAPDPLARLRLPLRGIASAELRTKDAGDLAAILPGLSGGRRNALFSPRLEPGDTRFLLSPRLSASGQVPILRGRIGSVQPEASCAASDLRPVRRGPLQTHPSCHQWGSAS